MIAEIVAATAALAIASRAGFEIGRGAGVPTQLVVYPGEYHVFSRPSFLVDRWQRFLDWMDQYLKER